MDGSGELGEKRGQKDGAALMTINDLLDLGLNFEQDAKCLLFLFLLHLVL
jgi:hypothetical protein